MTIQVLILWIGVSSCKLVYLDISSSSQLGTLLIRCTAQLPRRRDYRRLRAKFRIPEAWLQQEYVQRQTIKDRRKLDTVFGLHGYTKRDDGYHFH